MSTDSTQDQLTPEQQEEIISKIKEADKILNTPPPLPNPEFVHRGSIPYRIEWRDKKAHICVESNLSFNDRIFIMYVVQADFNDLIESIRLKKNNIDRQFTNDEKRGISKARFMIDKFLNRFLGIVYTDIMRAKKMQVPPEMEKTEVAKQPILDRIKNEVNEFRKNTQGSDTVMRMQLPIEEIVELKFELNQQPLKMMKEGKTLESVDAIEINVDGAKVIITEKVEEPVAENDKSAEVKADENL